MVLRNDRTDGALPWKLLGVHSSRMDMSSRDVTQDEALGLNCAWYADVLMAMTAEPATTVSPQAELPFSSHAEPPFSSPAEPPLSSRAEGEGSHPSAGMRFLACGSE